MSSNSVRLQKFIADCGVASRRDAEELIRHGEVTINGRVVTEMGVKVTPGSDAVKVKGKLLRGVQTPIYIAMNKPNGVLTTLKDPEGRPTVRDLLVGVRERVFPVGRLDYQAEGLVILTNDGDYAQKLIHPKQEIRKVYQVKVEGSPPAEIMQRLRAGVTLAEGRTRVAHIEKIPSGGKHSWYKVVLTEGRNQQISRMFYKLGHNVLKVKRVAIGKLTIGKLDRGQFRLLTKEQAEAVFR